MLLLHGASIRCSGYCSYQLFFAAFQELEDLFFPGDIRSLDVLVPAGHKVGPVGSIPSASMLGRLIFSAAFVAAEGDCGVE